MVPESEQLTEARIQAALKEGLTRAQAEREWRRMKLCDFSVWHSDVNRTWARWCMTAADRLGAVPEAKAPRTYRPGDI